LMELWNVNWQFCWNFQFFNLLSNYWICQNVKSDAGRIVSLDHTWLQICILTDVTSPENGINMHIYSQMEFKLGPSWMVCGYL
jgi:hypothetical protein